MKAPLNKQTYSVPTVGIEDLDTLDPALAYAPNSTNAIQMIYTDLVGLNDTSQVTPQTAASWPVDAKGTTRTFHLCPHLQFEEALVQGTFLVEILEN